MMNKLLILLILFMVVLCCFPKPKEIKKKEENFTDKKITFYKGEKYDLSNYISIHPGGSIINKAINKDIEKVWEENNVGWHKNNKYIIKHLKKMKL